MCQCDSLTLQIVADSSSALHVDLPPTGLPLPRPISKVSHLPEKHSTKSGQIMIFHQPRFPWNKGISLTKPPFGGNRSCEVVIIWPDQIYKHFLTAADGSTSPATCAWHRDCKHKSPHGSSKAQPVPRGTKKVKLTFCLTIWCQGQVCCCQSVKRTSKSIGLLLKLYGLENCLAWLELKQIATLKIIQHLHHPHLKEIGRALNPSTRCGSLLSHTCDPMRVRSFQKLRAWWHPRRLKVELFGPNSLCLQWWFAPSGWWSYKWN